MPKELDELSNAELFSALRNTDSNLGELDLNLLKKSTNKNIEKRDKEVDLIMPSKDNFKKGNLLAAVERDYEYSLSKNTSNPSDEIETTSMREVLIALTPDKELEPRKWYSIYTHQLSKFTTLEKVLIITMLVVGIFASATALLF